MTKRSKGLRGGPITVDAVVLALGVIGLTVAVLMSISTGISSNAPSSAGAARAGQDNFLAN